MSRRIASIVGFTYSGARLLSISEEGDHLRAVRFKDGVPLPEQPMVPIIVTSPGSTMDISPSHQGVPLFSARAFEVLGELLAKDVQFVRGAIEGSDETLWACNILSRVDCLERKLPSHRHFTLTSLVGDPVMMGVNPDKTVGHHMFRPVGYDVMVMVSEEFIEAVLRHDLIGPGLDLLTEDEHGHMEGLMPGFEQLHPSISRKAGRGKPWHKRADDSRGTNQA